jgi:hypothetical protein
MAAPESIVQYISSGNCALRYERERFRLEADLLNTNSCMMDWPIRQLVGNETQAGVEKFQYAN